MNIEFNATVSERIDLGPETTIFRVVPNGWELSEFKPGQFATLGLLGSAPRCVGSEPDKKEIDPTKLIRRAYSIASSPLNKDFLEFVLVLVKDGVLTPRLWNLKVGDRVSMGQKITGSFTMDEVPEDKNIILIGTGTGIAPYRSMIQTYLKPNQKRRFALLHGCRVSQDLAYRGEMVWLNQFCTNFNYFPMISRPHLDPIPWKGALGHVQKFLEEKVVEKAWGFKPSPNDTHIFLCGSPGMIEESLKLLSQDGFKEHTKKEPGQVHVERYW